MDVDVWLHSVLPRHERLTPIVVSMLQGMIKQEGIDHLSVTGRTKSHADAKEKIGRKEYRTPQMELTDISGIRVITFFESQVDRVSRLVEESFNIDSDNSFNKADLLGTDRLGYRSVHYVCDLGGDRASLTEYKAFHDLKFEIQVRTVLQHAWAELAHDRNYKFSGILPTTIQRKLNLYAGMLEIADQGFNELSAEIDQYQANLDSQSSDALLAAELNSLSLTKYLQNRVGVFSFPVTAQSTDELSDVVGELRRYGAKIIGDVDELFTDAFVGACNQHIKDASYLGLPRDAMMYSDLNRYFDRSWQESSWGICDRDTVNLLASKYGSDAIYEAFGLSDISVSD